MCDIIMGRVATFFVAVGRATGQNNSDFHGGCYMLFHFEKLASHFNQKVDKKDTENM
jgi:hypothetical protein